MFKYDIIGNIKRSNSEIRLIFYLLIYEQLLNWFKIGKNREMYMEDKIKKTVAKHLKLYIGRGPQYVKVNMTNDLINIHVNGILSKVGENLIKQGAVELPQMAWEELKTLFLDSFINELSSEVNKKCSLVLEQTDFVENTRTLIIKIHS